MCAHFTLRLAYISFLSFLSCVFCIIYIQSQSYINCHGVKTSSDIIKELCGLSDMIFLQELWLYPDELTYLSNLSSDFCSYSLSSMTLDDKLILDRPHGGIGIMWRKALEHGAKIVKFDDKRILGLELKTNDCILLFYVSIYPMNVTCFKMIFVFI